MTIGLSTTVRNTRVTAISDAIDGGSGAGLLRQYNGTRPATGGSATTLLAQLPFSDPCSASVSNGVNTFAALTADSSADNTGTATWCRAVDSSGTFVMDASSGGPGSGADCILDNPNIVAGANVSCSSFVITEGAA